MTPKHIHFVGIGGISLSALAIMLKKDGYDVSGSDVTQSPETQMLQKNGIKIYFCHKAENVIGAQMVVYSSAIHQDNPEIVEAKKLGIKIISRAELLGQIASTHQKVIAVAGSHGKTTTTGMIASIFLLANKNPTIHIGANLPIIGGNVKVGGKEYFITEACEYCDSFLTLQSSYGVVLNIQKDHMDYFKNMSKMQNSFKNFAKNTKQSGFLIINADDKSCMKLPTKAQKISYGIDNFSHIQAKNINADNKQRHSFDLYVCGAKLGRINLSVCGRHNVYNALASVAVALGEGIKFATIKRALKKYKSSHRRFEQIKGTKATVVHDYAHHPTEIKATIATARKMCKGKLIVAFEPHTFSRTQYLWKDFTKCFDGADKLFLCPIYPAREEPIKNITSERLAVAIEKTGMDVLCTSSLEDCVGHIQQFNKKGNMILLLGAGTIVKMTEYFEK